MANIKIADLQPTQVEFAELSDLELETVLGGSKNRYEWAGGILGAATGAIFGGPQGALAGARIGRGVASGEF